MRVNPKGRPNSPGNYANRDGCYVSPPRLCRSGYRGEREAGTSNGPGARAVVRRVNR